MTSRYLLRVACRDRLDATVGWSSFPLHALIDDDEKVKAGWLSRPLSARALGFRQLITYTLASESGISLTASGWRVIGQTAGQANGWNVPSRPRVVKAPTEAKTLWEA